MFYLAQPGQVYTNGNKNYEVIEALGFGANGVVYSAKDQHGNTIALKYQKEFFEREYELLKLLVDKTSQMNHVIKIIDVFPEDNDLGPLITIMELGGQDFEKYISQQGYQKLSVLEKLTQAADILQGIIELHEKGLFHRDIKPQNIVQVQDKWKLCDLGLIKVFQEQDEKQTKMVGTGLYLPPELYPDSIYQIDKRVDVWSFAVMLHFLIHDEYPFDPKLLRKLNTVFDEKILKIKETDLNLHEFFKLMLRVDPQQRINSYDALVYLKTKLLYQQMVSSQERRDSVAQYSTLQLSNPKHIQEKGENQAKIKKINHNQQQQLQDQNKKNQHQPQRIQQAESHIIFQQDNLKMNEQQFLNQSAQIESLEGKKQEIQQKKQKNISLLTDLINDEKIRQNCIALANQGAIPKDKRIELILAQINKPLKQIFQNMNQRINDQKI